MPPTLDHTPSSDGSSRTDERGWDGLVQRYARLVWSVPRGHGFDAATASQIAQTCWLRLVEQVDETAAPVVGTWLTRAARQESGRAAKWHEGGRDGVHDASLTEPLLRALAELPARLRLALRVSAVEPAPSDDELATSLDLQPDGVSAAVAQGLERLAAGDGAADPDQLLGRLRSAVAAHDEPPPALMAAARSAFSWRALDAELAPLTDEGARDDLLAGVRGTPGVRRLTFDADGRRVDLEVSVDGRHRSLLGQLTPAEPTPVVLRHAEGGLSDVSVDDLGRFACDGLSPGQISLRLAGATGRACHTDWVLL